MTRARRSRGVSVALLAVLAAATAFTGWLLIVYPQSGGGGDGTSTRIEVTPGADPDRLVEQLAAAGVVRDPTLFGFYLHLIGAEDRLRDATVSVDDRMTVRQVLTRIASGYGEVHERVTIPEGWDRFQVAERLEEQGVCRADAFLAVVADGDLAADSGIEADSFEGYLFPDTYDLPLDTEPRDLVERMRDNFRRRVEPLFDEESAGFERLRSDLGWTRHDVLTLASIVEEESAVDEERPIIAGVFLNRLRFDSFRPKRLQADPTVRYGCKLHPAISRPCRDYTGRITRSMLADTHNPYNTYRNEGLPPGPITNPGVASVRAVLAPAEHDYLYFVARGQGRHVFSATLDEHNAAVREHQR